MSTRMLFLAFFLTSASASKVMYTTKWPAGRHSYAGARGYFEFPDLYTGTCTIFLPLSVPLFVGENFDIVPHLSDNRIGKYVLVAPYKAYNEPKFNFLLRFYPGKSFSAEGIEWSCDISQEADVGIRSFPTDLTQNLASSHVWIPGLRRKSQITLYFPFPVEEFRAFGAGKTTKRAHTIYTLSGFYLEQDEVWFQFQYKDGKIFDATQIKVEEHIYR
ncbi:uncharacterized protein LOC120341933 [Styela clava]